MPASERTLPTSSAATAGAAEGMVRQSLVQLAVSVVAVFLALGLVGAFFGAELAGAATWISAAIGLPGMATVVFAIDTLTLPVPPDTVLLVVASGPMSGQWIPIVIGLGLVSALAGNAGYFIARGLGHTPFVERMMGGSFAKVQALFARYGVIAVALGALTPLPFSVSCWAAGIFRMPWPSLALTTLLRVPRFVAYYLLIAASVHAF